MERLLLLRSVSGPGFLLYMHLVYTIPKHCSSDYRARLVVC